jgi:NADH-quinone oxidoreductase subunit M
MNYYPLIIVTFFPAVGILIIALLKQEQKKAIRWVALITSIITFGISLWILSLYDPNNPNIQLTVKLLWLKAGDIEVNFLMGLDGMNLLLLLLTTFISPLTILYTWGSINERVKAFMLFFLFQEISLIGVFLALDLIFFFIFWEFSLIPMYFIIGIWGHERRIYATLKFILFTMTGSAFMLIAFLFLGLTAGTFSWIELINNRALFANYQLFLFIFMAIGFAVKVPMWPLHTWLPDAHVEAPAAGSVMLAGILLKLGTYGFLRFNLFLFPELSIKAAPYIGALALIAILYGAAVSYAQKNFKKLVAFSSVSHLGFVMLGLFALNQQGISGGILQMINHGLSTSALFLIVGMLYERRHSLEFAAFGGIWKAIPVLGGITLVVTLSSMGLPGLNGFVGEFTILLGAFHSTALRTYWIAGIAALGVILAAIYLLVMFERAYLGPIKHEENRKLPDINIREVLVLVPILIFIFWIGLYPKSFFDLINPTVQNLVSIVQSTAVAMH